MYLGFISCPVLSALFLSFIPLLGYCFKGFKYRLHPHFAHFPKHKQIPEPALCSLHNNKSQPFKFFILSFSFKFRPRLLCCSLDQHGVFFSLFFPFQNWNHPSSTPSVFFSNSDSLDSFLVRGVHEDGKSRPGVSGFGHFLRSPSGEGASLPPSFFEFSMDPSTSGSRMFIKYECVGPHSRQGRFHWMLTPGAGNGEGRGGGVQSFKNVEFYILLRGRFYSSRILAGIMFIQCVSAPNGRCCCWTCRIFSKVRREFNWKVRL